jgi:hypothetical protein
VKEMWNASENVSIIEIFFPFTWKCPQWEMLHQAFQKYFT